MGSVDFEKTSSESIRSASAGYVALSNAWTIVAIVTVESQPGAGAVNSIYSFDCATATNDLLFGLDGNSSNWLGVLTNSVILSAGFGLSTLGNWYLISVRKATGTTAANFEVYNYVTGVWSTATSGSTTANRTGQTGTPAIGCGVGAVDFWDGRIAAVGVWKRALTSGEIRQLVYRKFWLNSLRRGEIDGGKQFFDLSRRTSSRFSLDFFTANFNYSVGTQPAVGLMVNDTLLHHPPGW